MTLKYTTVDLLAVECDMTSSFILKCVKPKLVFL